MPDKDEKERRKKIMDELAENAKKEFEQSLPASRETFKSLFDHLDDELGKHDCDNRLTLTQQFLTNNKILNSDEILNWLLDNGGGCDCEVLANVEDLFEY